MQTGRSGVCPWRYSPQAREPLSPLLNAHSLTFSVIKRAISFSLNLHGSGYDLLRSPLGFCENIASHGLRLSYEALSFSMR